MARHGENIHKRKDGRWEARLLIGHDSTGRCCYRSFYGKSYQEARNKRKCYEDSIPKSGTGNRQKKITVSQLLNDWLFFIRPSVKESTYARYEFYVERHIGPVLGKKELYELTTEEIDRFSRNKLLNGSLNGKRGLAPKTVNSILSVIKLAAAFGLEREYPISTRLIIHSVRQPIPGIQVLSAAEQRILESFLMMSMDHYRLGILISLYTGLRIGEVCGLRWEDIRFESGTLTVQRTVMRIQNRDPEAEVKTKLLVSRPKTDCSVRTIPLPEFLLCLLKQYQKSPDVFVLSGRRGAEEPRCFYNIYKKIMEQVGLERYNYHALRHTFATRCVEQDFDIKSLSEILGHADVSITLRRYVHPSMDLKRKQMERLSNICFYGQNPGQKR